MADYNQLNKAKPQDQFSIIFKKQAKLSSAILSLVETAYLNHHLETDERNKKLVECLFNDSKVLFDQLSDDNFKVNLSDYIKTTVQKTVRQNKSNVDLEQIQKDVLNVINENIKPVQKEDKVDNKSDISDTLKEIIKNKKIQEDVHDISNDEIQKSIKENTKTIFGFFLNEIKTARAIQKKSQTKKPLGIFNPKKNKEQIIKLKKIFNKKGKTNQKKIFKTLGMTGVLADAFNKQMLNRLKKQRKTLKKVSNRLGRKIKGLVGGFSIKKLFSKGVGFVWKIMKSIGSIVFNAVGFLVGGIFKLVTGIIGFGVKIISGAFHLVKNVLGTALKVTKKAISGLFHLTTSIVKRASKFIMTPTGMFVTGFIIGFVYKKAQKLYYKLKAKATILFNKAKKFVHKTRMNIINLLKKDTVSKKLKKLAQFVVNLPKMKFKLYVKYMEAKKYLAHAVSAVGGIVGAGAAGLAAKALSTGIKKMVPKMPPWVDALLGVGVALAIIAGNVFGEQLATIPKEKDITINEFAAQFRKHVRQDRGQSTGGVKFNIESKVERLQARIEADNEELKELDSQIQELSNKEDRTEEEDALIDELQSRFNLAIKRKHRHQEQIGALQAKLVDLERIGGDNYFSETDKERSQNEEYIDIIKSFINLEKSKGAYYGSNNTPSIAKYNNGKYAMETIYGRSLVQDEYGDQVFQSSDVLERFDNFFRRVQQKQPPKLYAGYFSLNPGGDWSDNYRMRGLSFMLTRSIEMAMQDYYSGLIPFNKRKGDTVEVMGGLRERAEYYLAKCKNLMINIGKATMTFDELMSGNKIAASANYNDFMNTMVSNMDSMHEKWLSDDYSIKECADEWSEAFFKTLPDEVLRNMTDKDRNFVKTAMFNILKERKVKLVKKKDGSGKDVWDLATTDEKEREEFFKFINTQLVNIKTAMTMVDPNDDESTVESMLAKITNSTALMANLHLDNGGTMDREAQRAQTELEVTLGTEDENETPEAKKLRKAREKNRKVHKLLNNWILIESNINDYDEAPVIVMPDYSKPKEPEKAPNTENASTGNTPPTVSSQGFWNNTLAPKLPADKLIPSSGQQMIGPRIQTTPKPVEVMPYQFSPFGSSYFGM